jgi:hypothetical protein
MGLEMLSKLNSIAKSLVLNIISFGVANVVLFRIGKDSGLYLAIVVGFVNVIFLVFGVGLFPTLLASSVVLYLASWQFGPWLYGWPAIVLWFSALGAWVASVVVAWSDEPVLKRRKLKN